VVDFLPVPERNGAISGQGDTAFVHDGDFAGHFFLDQWSI
jgi:hypothetical protein